VPGSEDLKKSDMAARKVYEKDLRLAISYIADVILLTKWSKDLNRLLLVVVSPKKIEVSGSGSVKRPKIGGETTYCLYLSPAVCHLKDALGGRLSY
jgi:hypothetical protein